MCGRVVEWIIKDQQSCNFVKVLIFFIWFFAVDHVTSTMCRLNLSFILNTAFLYFKKILKRLIWILTIICKIKRFKSELGHFLRKITWQKLKNRYHLRCRLCRAEFYFSKLFHFMVRAFYEVGIIRGLLCDGLLWLKLFKTL